MYIKRWITISKKDFTVYTGDQRYAPVNSFKVLIIPIKDIERVTRVMYDINCKKFPQALR